MRLRDRFDHRGAESDRDETLDADVRRELEALDRALAGLPVEPEFDAVARLAADLRAERPEPHSELDSRLDRLAAAGFPPRESDRLARAQRRLGRSVDGLRGRGFRRLVPAIGAASLFVVVAGVAINQTGVLEGSRGGGGDSASVVTSQPEDGSAGGQDNAAALEDSGRSGAVAKDAGNDELQRLAAPGRDARTLYLGALNGPTSASEIPFGKRKIAQEIDIALSTSPGDFRDAADGVLDVVRDHRGFVRDSTVSSGRGGGVPVPLPGPIEDGVAPERRGDHEIPFGQASFDLRIPANELQATIAALSDLGHVVSRTDGQQDVTSRFISAKKRIDALTATRENLLEQLAVAVTIAEQESIERRIQIVEDQLAAAEDELGDVKRRVQLVPVSVTITADPNVKDRGDGDKGGAWGIGDAFDDAGRILVVAASVAVVVGAALIPFGLLGVLIWLVWRGWVVRARERALDSAPAG